MADKFTFIWRIKYFEMWPDQWGKNIKSPEFGIYNWKNPKFRMLLYAGGVNENNSMYLSLYLVKASHGDENYIYNITLGILTKEEKIKCFKSSKKLEEGNGIGDAQFLKREKFQSSEKDIFLPDGNLTVFCEIKPLHPYGSENHSVSFQLKELSDTYEIIYEKENYCDLYLHVGEKTFKVHRAVVEARFPDLLRDIDGNKCKIKCIGSTTMDSILRYIYTGILNKNEINLFELLSSGYVLPSHLKHLLIEKQNKIETTTCFQKKVMSFSCIIQNFSSLDSSKVINYPLIGDNDAKWTWLDLSISKTTDEEYITFSIQRFSKDCKRIVCTIITSEISKTFIHTFVKEDKWTLPNYFSKDMLKSTTVDDNSDEINFKFEIAISDGSKTSEMDKIEFFLSPTSANQSIEDLNSYLKDLVAIMNSPKYCDVTLLAGKEKFPAHKFILTARSSVFSDMFQSESAKKESSEITIDYLDASMIKDVLAYMYCNEVKFSSSETNHINKIYSVASKYKLTGLKRECLGLLKSEFSAETAGDILVSAYEWNDENLKELVYNYVCTHPLEIYYCKEWEQIMLKRSDLALEVLKKTLADLAAKNKIINIETG